MFIQTENHIMLGNILFEKIKIFFLKHNILGYLFKITFKEHAYVNLFQRELVEAY